MDDVDDRPYTTSGEPHGRATVVPGGDVTTVVIAGEVDVAIKDELSDALEDAVRRRLPVEVDCAQVQFIDSSGLSCLAWLANLTPDPPRLLDVPATMHELLRLTGMDGVFTFGTRETLG